MRIVLLVGFAVAWGLLGCKKHDTNDAPRLSVAGVAVVGDQVEGDIVNDGIPVHFAVANFRILDGNGIQVGSASALQNEVETGETRHFIAPVIEIYPPPTGAGSPEVAELASISGG